MVGFPSHIAMGVARLLLVAVVGVVALAACSPPDRHFLALSRNSDDKAVLHVVLCPDDGLFSVVVGERSETLSPPTRQWGVHAQNNGERLSELELLVVPKGWKLGEPATLTALADDTSYGVGVSTSRGRNAYLTFSPPQLDNLKDGEVWALFGKPGKDEEVISLEAFVKRAEREC